MPNRIKSCFEHERAPSRNFRSRIYSQLFRIDSCFNNKACNPGIVAVIHCLTLSGLVSRCDQNMFHITPLIIRLRQIAGLRAAPIYVSLRSKQQSLRYPGNRQNAQRAALRAAYPTLPDVAWPAARSAALWAFCRRQNAPEGCNVK